MSFLAAEILTGSRLINVSRDLLTSFWRKVGHRDLQPLEKGTLSLGASSRTLMIFLVDFGIS